jgi:hypothetical protein
MKLTDIIIREEAPAGQPIELKELTKYFPNTYEKAARTLAKSGRLMFGGEAVFTKSGEYGPALERAIAEAEALLKDESSTVNIRLELDGTVADIDEHGEYDVDYPVTEAQEVYVGYSARGNKLIIGFDAWLDEEIFNQDFDKQFEETFGLDFDMDDDGHEKIFNATREQFQKYSFMGLVVEVNEDFYATFEDMPYEGGFYRGAHPKLKSRRIIDLRLD